MPDAFIAKGLEQRRRRIYRLWVEGVVPQLVIETTSKSTRAWDTNDKPELFAKLGVHEYFLHDPTGEYLEPSLQGYRLVDGKYDPIEADVSGGLLSTELGLILRMTDGNLNLFYPKSLKRLLTDAETAEGELAARKRAVEKRRQAKAARDEEAEARRRAELDKQAAEAEIERLRAELKKYQS